MVTGDGSAYPLRSCRYFFLRYAIEKYAYRCADPGQAISYNIGFMQAHNFFYVGQANTESMSVFITAEKRIKHFVRNARLHPGAVIFNCDPDIIIRFINAYPNLSLFRLDRLYSVYDNIQKGSH